MMTGLEIFALAVSVMQTISFSYHDAATLKQIYAGYSADSRLRRAADQLHMAIESR